MKKRREDPRGQVLIMTAASMIVLIGIAALVVDLGFSWMLRRQEQNAADPAAIAAARHLKDAVGDPTWSQGAGEADACFYAQENGFFEDDPGCVAALAAGDLQVHAPPITGDYASRAGFVQVIVRDQHPSFFGRIFGRSHATVTTAAVAANTAGNANSASLVALQPVCEAGSAADVDGGGEVNIFPIDPSFDGGYVHVNSPCGGSTDDNCENGVGQAALSISGTLTAPQTNVTGSCTYNGSGANGLQCYPVGSTNCLDEEANPLGDPLANLPEPNLADFNAGVCPDGTPSSPSDTAGCDIRRGPNCPADPLDSAIDICTLSPGIYYGGWQVGSRVRVFLEPGMYILAGGGIRLAGTEASIEAVTSPTVAEARIMIFSTDGPGCPSIGAQCQGEVRFTAAQAFKAKALNSATCGLVSPNACPWKGILLWQDGTASNPDAPVYLGGQSSTVLAGTIYAPKAEVQVTGGSATTGCTVGPTSGCLAIQIISYRWKISGDGVVDMPYDPSELYQLDQRGLVE
jgi:hypothetical protein